MLFSTCSIYSCQLQFCLRVSWNCLYFGSSYMLFSVPFPSLPILFVQPFMCFLTCKGSCTARSTALLLIAYYFKGSHCCLTFADAPHNQYQESPMPGFVGSLLFSLYLLLFWARCHLQSLLTVLACLSLGSICSGFPGPSEPALFYNIHVQCCPYQTSYLKLITKIVLSWTRPHFGSFKVN